MAVPKRLHSFMAWQGASTLDGNPIALLVTRGYKANKKTGGMIQTYIIRTDKDPVEVLRQGEDKSICGDCRHSSKANGGQGTCYVRVDTGVLQVYRAFKRGRYPAISVNEAREQVAGYKVRLGTYGDPSAIPQDVWTAFLADVSACTGYTHGWQRSEFQWLKGYAMASCDTLAEYNQARSEGWRTFYVVPKGTGKVAGAFLCPASEEGGRKLTCSECLACDGQHSGRTASVYIPVHGVAFKQARFTNNLITIGRV